MNIVVLDGLTTTDVAAVVCLFAMLFVIVANLTRSLGRQPSSAVLAAAFRNLARPQYPQPRLYLAAKLSGLVVLLALPLTKESPFEAAAGQRLFWAVVFVCQVLVAALVWHGTRPSPPSV